MTTTAYRGYLIRTGLGRMWVEKDSTLIAWVTSLAQARSTIDMLVD